MKSVQLVPLTGWWPRLIIWMYIATMIALALWSLDEVRSPWPTVAAIVVFLGIGVALSRDAAQPMSLWCATLVAVAWPAVAALVSWQLLVAGGHSQWFFGAGTVSLFYVSMRGRVAIAWAGFIALAGVTVVWGVTTDTGLIVALSLIGKQLPIMIVGTLFAVGLRRAAASIERLTAEASMRASAEAAALATTAERNERLAGLDAVATALISRIVDGTPLTADDRLEFSVAEAELRDSLRARALSVPAVVAAARLARRRGVDVVLLDDSDPDEISPDDLGYVIDRVGEALADAEDGRVVARLLPPGRSEVATLLIDGSRNPRHEVVHARTADEPSGSRGGEPARRRTGAEEIRRDWPVREDELPRASGLLLR